MKFITISKLAMVASLTATIMYGCKKRDLSPEHITEKDGKTKVEAAGTGPYDVLGYGYNVTGEYANSNSSGYPVINISGFKASLPDRLIEEAPRTQQYLEEYGSNAYQYSQMISRKVEVTTGYSFFKSTLSSSFSSSQSFESKYIYGSYNLTIKHNRYRLNATADILRNYLTATFIDDINSKSPQEIVRDYGTHVSTDIYTGAKLEIIYQAETNNQNKETAARAGIKVGVFDKFGLTLDNSIDKKAAEQNFFRKLSYRTRGGDPSKGLIGEINLEQNSSGINISNWQGSSTSDNSVLVDFGQNGLIPLYDLVSDSKKRNALKGFIDQYLIDNQLQLIYSTYPVYAYYNQSLNVWRYEFNPERVPYLHDGSWAAKGIQFQAYKEQAPGTVPIYEFYAPATQDCTWGQNNLSSSYWQNGGVKFYAHSTPLTGIVPVYSYYHHKSQRSHFLGKDPGKPWPQNEWTNEGIAFYAK